MERNGPPSDAAVRTQGMMRKKAMWFLWWVRPAALE
jgi:hypothetical protein